MWFLSKILTTFPFSDLDEWIPVRSVRIRVVLNQTLPVSFSDGLIDFGDPQFAIDAFHMKAHRVQADDQLFGNLIVGVPLCQKSQNLQLSFGQRYATQVVIAGGRPLW